MHWAPNDVMLDLLEQLADDPARADMRYVLALLLVRRRVCRLEETQHGEPGHEQLVLLCPRREQEYRVMCPRRTKHASKKFKKSSPASYSLPDV